MDEQFNDLRRTLRSTDEEMRRFRQLVVSHGDRHYGQGPQGSSPR
jgi:hypothetical protein